PCLPSLKDSRCRDASAEWLLRIAPRCVACSLRSRTAILMFSDLSTELILLLAAAAFLAGFIDSIAGGGGLVTVPALLLAGFSPVQALGTNKLQGLFGAASATIAYASKGHVDLRKQLPSAAMSFLGAFAGAALATILPGEWLHAALPPMLIAIALYFAFKPNMDDIDRAERLSPFLFGL